MFKNNNKDNSDQTKKYNKQKTDETNLLDEDHMKYFQTSNSGKNIFLQLNTSFTPTNNIQTPSALLKIINSNQQSKNIPNKS